MTVVIKWRVSDRVDEIFGSNDKFKCLIKLEINLSFQYFSYTDALSFPTALQIG